MKMTRKRARELQGTECCLTYMGPIDTGQRFCEEGAPTTLEACGFLTDDSVWVYDTIQVEPEWVLEYSDANRVMGNGWYVYNADDRRRDMFGIPWINAKVWRTKERAEAYLNLWKEEWWDDNN